jgi:hypothetical protein
VEFELKSIKLIKYWLPQSFNVQTDFVHHIIYTITVQKSKIKTQDHLNQKLLKWINVSNLKEYSLRNRFVAEYLGCTSLIGENNRQSRSKISWPIKEVVSIIKTFFVEKVYQNSCFFGNF